MEISELEGGGREDLKGCQFGTRFLDLNSNTSANDSAKSDANTNSSAKANEDYLY